MFAIVDDEQRVGVSQMCDGALDRRGIGDGGRRERGAQRLGDQRAVLNRREFQKPDALIGRGQQVPADLDRRAGFAGPARSDQGDEAPGREP